jgi:drug/metabolite transporter (DMT)-like permease
MRLSLGVIKRRASTKKGPWGYRPQNPLHIPAPAKLDPSMTLLLIGLAISGLSVHLCTVEAFRYGDAIVVVPLDFLRVPLIALIGWSFYGERLDVLAGAGLIMAGVIWNLRTEARAQGQSRGFL